MRFFGPLCHGSRSKFSFAAYDVETRSKEDWTFELIGFFDGEKYSCFRDLASFFDAVLTPRYSGWRIFGHFAGRFDVHFLWDWLRSNHPEIFKFPRPGVKTYKIDVITAGSAVIAMTIGWGEWRIDGRRFKFHADSWWRFTDSYRLMPAGLRQLTYEFDVPHKKLDFDSTSWVYNRNDCMGLHEVLTRFFDEFGVSSETAASHAMRVFRTHFMHRRIAVPPDHAEKIARFSYTGGRCEIFRWDQAEVNKFDINSLYPWAMRGNVPVEYLYSSKELPDDDSKLIGFYDATVEYPDDIYIPALPVRFDKLFFPSGKMRGFFTSMELRQAIADRARVSIEQGRIFASEPILAEYVDELYKRKLDAEKSGDPAKRYISKLLSNSLYGKFGETRDKRSHTTDPGTIRLYGDPPPGMRAPQAERFFGPELWPVDATGMCFYFSESRSLHILPSIASAVTSRARLRTLEYLRGAGRVWYTDTDSVFTDSQIPVSDELGAMKLEGSGKFKPYRLKEYEFDGHIALKGVPLTREDPATGNKIEDLTLAKMYLSGQEIRLSRMAGFNESLNLNLPAVRRVEVTRKFRQPFEKRARTADGDTRPWRVEEILK